jgi:hypothetical protein
LFALFASDVGVASDRCRHTTGHMGIFMPWQHADQEYWVCGAQHDTHQLPTVLMSSLALLQTRLVCDVYDKSLTLEHGECDILHALMLLVCSAPLLYQGPSSL